MFEQHRRPSALALWIGSGGCNPQLAQSGEESAYVVDQKVGGFQGCEMAAGVEIAPVHDVVVLFGEPPDRDILGESCHSGGNLARLGPVTAVCALVVQVC